MSDEKETTDLAAAILAVEDEDAAADAESLDGSDAADETPEGDGKAAAKDEPAKEPDWVAEYERTENPHVIQDPVLRAFELKRIRTYTEKFEKVARMADRIKELEAERKKPEVEVPEDDGPPNLPADAGGEIDPEWQKALDARVRWHVNKRLEALGLDKLPEQFQTTQQTQQEREAQEYADKVFDSLRKQHGLTDDDIAYASQVMAPEDPGIVALLKTDKGRKRFAMLVRAERGTTEKAKDDIKNKAAAGEAATLRPSRGVKGARQVKDWSAANKEEILADIAEQKKRLGIE